MKEIYTRIMNKKSFHIGIILFIIFIILITSGFIILRYQVEGETNMPFIISKISIISSSEGIDREEQIEGNRWNFDVSQNNDIYIYVEKNKQYTKQEAIEEILINNIKMTKKSEKGELKVYKPDVQNENIIFSNKEENSVESLTYGVQKDADMKNLKITNQGGIIAFRFSNNKVAQYVSNDEEIKHDDLLNKCNLTQEELSIGIEFDFIIKLNSQKEYKSTISLELPLEGVIEKGTVSKEFTDTQKYIFKRIKN